MKYEKRIKGGYDVIGLLNLGSLVLGIIAWIIPIINLLQYDKHRNWIAFTIISISACSVSLYFQLFYNYHLVKIKDWSALMDTMSAVVFAATVLLIGTVILNIIAFIKYKDRAARF